MNRIQKLLFGAVAFAAMAGPALAETPELEPCKTGAKAVTLVFRTDTTSGWTVNGAPVSSVGNGAWANVSPASWIARAGARGPAHLCYTLTLGGRRLPGPLTLQARWAADNCGVSLQAGTGPVKSTGACTMSPAPNGKDFLSFTRTTTTSFAPGDSANPSPTITFTVSNQNGTATGFAGEFTVTALCVCRG